MAISTLRILNLDGGGMKGYLSNRFLSKFIQTWGINPAELWKHFDVITGTSIGGIQALAYAYGKTPDEIANFFVSDGPWIFTIRNAADLISGSINASTPSNRPNVAQKLLILGDNDQFYRSVDQASNYGSSRLRTVLTDNFGTDTLQDLKTNVLVPSFRDTDQNFILFSNLNYADFRGQDESLVNVALATSSAPLYLPPTSFNNQEYIDGGVYQNNPARLGLTLAKMIKPTATKICVLSLGTGLGEKGFHEEPVATLAAAATLPFEATIKRLVSLIGIGITGGAESVAKDISLASQYTLDNIYSYRFQPNLDPMINTEIDNSEPSFLSYMEDLATQHFNDDIDDIINFIGHLTS